MRYIELSFSIEVHPIITLYLKHYSWLVVFYQTTIPEPVIVLQYGCCWSPKSHFSYALALKNLKYLSNNMDIGSIIGHVVYQNLIFLESCAHNVVITNIQYKVFVQTVCICCTARTLSKLSGHYMSFCLFSLSHKIKIQYCVY